MKRILLIGLGLLSVSALYGMKKYNEFIEIIKNLQVKIYSIKNFKIDFTSLVVKVDLGLKIFNFTDNTFNTSILPSFEIEKIEIFASSGLLLANIDTSITNVELPSNGIYYLPMLQFKIPFKTFIKEFGNIINGIDFNSLSYKIHVIILGKKHII